MMKMIFYRSTLVALLLGNILFIKILHADIAQEVQVQYLINLAQLEGVSFDGASFRRTAKNNAMAPLSFAQLQQAARDSGMEVINKKMTFAELQKMDAPVIIRLLQPDELITIAAIGQQSAIVYQGTTLQLMPVEVLLQRYSGEALFFKKHLNQIPRIVVNEPVREVKINTIGGAFPFSVPVKNIGNKSLTLKVQSTSCGCTSDDASIRELKPGESGELHFKTTANTNRVVTAIITTSDPVRPVFVLAFQITMPKTVIRPILGVQVNGDIGQEVRTSLSVTLPSEVSVTKLISSKPFVIAKLGKIEQQTNSRIFHIDVVIKSNAPAGSFSSNLTLFLQDSDITQLSVPVSGYISDDIYFIPAMVFINDASVSYNVVLQSPAHKKFSITGWRSTNPAIEVQAPRNQPAETQHITIKVHTAENKTSPDGRIIFTLDNGQEMSLDIMNDLTMLH